MNKEEWLKETFDEISKDLQGKNSLSYLDFLKIRNFKLNNHSRATEEEISRITEEAFSLAKEDKISEAVKTLLKLHGVRVPVASAILAFYNKDKFAIVDNRVIKGIFKRKWIDQEKFNLWLNKYLTSADIYEEYILLLRKKSKNLRELEFELFAEG